LNQSETIRFPDFFLVGAPRCGTTALSRYLTRNPQICFSRPKEPHYFARIDCIPDTDELKRDYLDRCFAHRTSAHRVLGEGSVSYLYAPGAIERILHFNPQARFIVQLRNPLKMLPSYHLRMQFLLQEDQADFETAWGLQAARMRGESIPKRCLDPRLLIYTEVAKFGAQIERLFKIAGREQTHVIIFDDFASDTLQAARMRGESIPKRCLDPRLLIYTEVAKFGAQIERLFKIAGREQTHVIVFDDFASDTLGTYRRLLEFLGVDNDGQTDFERRFESQMYRYLWLQKLLFIPATSNGKIVGTLQQKARKYNPDGSKKSSWTQRLTRLNKMPKSPEPLTAQMADILRETLRPDIQHLSHLLDRDLSHWIDGE